MKSELILIPGIIKPGHQVASGNAINSPYDRGTIEMQLPFFKHLELDLTNFFLGTLNISIAPYKFKIIQPQYTFKNVQWHPNYPAETFSFSPCKVVFENISYAGFIYYPHPETKIGHFQDSSILEAIAMPIPNINYGDQVQLEINSSEIMIIST
jgi:hypothetical protein